MIRGAIVVACTAFAITPAATALAASPYDAMIAQHAAANGVPVDLVHRVIIRESRYRPHVISKGNYGMMQIKLATARGLGGDVHARQWRGPGFLVCNANDPEGNIFQIREKLPS